MQRLIDQVIDATGGKWTSNDFRCRAQKTLITRAEFEARKAERQGKPSWDDAPKWANWLMQDGSGFWLWFELRPSKYWVVEGGKYLEVNDGEVIGDWRDTLEQRPNHIGESADWYDYDKQEATKLPPVGELVEAAIPHTNGRDEKSVIWIEGRVIAYHEIKGKQYAWFAEDGDNGFYPPNVLQFRPLDWNRKQEVPSPSPELSFHLSNAFNELQASARLLPDSDPRKTRLAALTAAVSAIREVV